MCSARPANALATGSVMSRVRPYASNPSFLAAALSAADGSRVSLATTRAGMPTTVAPGGTSLTTTEFEPTRAFSPTVKGPRILAPAPTTTLLHKVGWRLPLFQLTPPRVTPW